VKTADITKSEALKAKIGLSGPPLNRIPGPPPLIPDHEMIRCIGQGSYGEVWLARSAVGTWRAVKVVYRQNFKDPRPYEREFAGIQIYEPISRSNEGLIDVLQIGRNDAEGYFYYVMELADSAQKLGDDQAEEPATDDHGRKTIDPDSYVPKTLSRVLQQRGRLSCEECLTLGLTLNLALGHLHRNRLIHRDVKPSNIVFINGVPKLTDIGLVTDLEGAQSFVGTEGFIPPEGPNSSQADLYALGKVLYEASMGRDRTQFPEPFTALGLDDQSKALMELNAVLIKACAPDPKFRYQRAEEMNADLALLHNGESVRDKHALARRLRMMTRVGVITMAILVLAVIPYSLIVREARRANRSARQAQIEATKSQRVADFLKKMLRGAAPSIAVGRDSTILREILDNTAVDIKDLKDQPAVEAELRLTLGQVYQELGEYTAAENMLTNALQLYEHIPGVSELTIAQCLNDLSMALSSQGKSPTAEPLQQRALDIRSKFREKAAGSGDLFKEYDLAVAQSLHNLGMVKAGKHELGEAENYFKQALEIRRQELDPTNYLIADSKNGVASMLTSNGRWPEAEEMFRQSLEIGRAQGPRNSTYVAALNGLVQSLLTQKKLPEAEADAREGVDLAKQLLGPEHPVVASSLARLARILEQGDRLPEARTNLEEALTIWRKRLDNQDPSMGETVSALLDILLSSTNYTEANDIFQQVLVPVASGERPNTSVLAVCGNYLARKSEWHQALDEFLKLLRLEPNNHHVYQSLAALYIKIGDERSYRELCTQILATFGSITNDPSIADRMAKTCLILPPDPREYPAIAKLANISVTYDTNAAASPWFQFCKGFAEYRGEHFRESERWMRKVLEHRSEGSTRDVEAYMVLAMAEHRSGQTNLAQEDFAEGKRFAARRLREENSGDIESGWTDWILAHSLMKEAQRVLDSPPENRHEAPD
jgi:serine/threonine protein kinase